ncbi:protein of unknown function (plasmid) [Cupriavidus taiwanensis]|uniref:Uncharacterized protein n=1 Tax=Cupriavidus taiwanensis TaxID=164546 RepID=A0A7Z7NMP5_9BURK|nr:protein of unknown function [Cupriavidus taiwanensis]SOZ42118.1 protein of unknown function [Cupriavidus taiwanensis]SPC21233.1 protein of unknown function [Cupriavidus taiwanensis]SPD55374.1 protein of unknown function [Cupriavidus taiwanensis]
MLHHTRDNLVMVRAALDRASAGAAWASREGV